MLATRRTRWFNVGRRLRTQLALWRATSWRPLLDLVVSAQPYLEPTLTRHPILFRPLLAQFLDVRLPMSARFAAVVHDLQFTAARIHDAFPGFFQHGASPVLWSDTADRFTLTLGLNTLCPEEGLWRVSLLDQHGQPVYGACFSIVPGPRLFIGVIQGGRASAGHDPRAAIRAATRHFGGLRPQFLLLQVLREFATAWDIPVLAGVADVHQVSRRRRRHTPLQVRFSYNVYFAEAAGQPDRDGNWTLAVKATERPMQTLPSRKRALYRRRAQLLQDIAHQVRAAIMLRASAPPGAAPTSAG